ncbi:hypothetical protein HAX54_045012 [Datura stramonium]|uniref:Lipoxygenase domain-containing protein n=1 Tax=Datura stramonium TaxID=4076 RepID=A0ABS8WFC9_DATST|nr:hypothetical protein [Datura stramonium]
MGNSLCQSLYPQENLIESDKEIQAWWTEIKNVGHATVQLSLANAAMQIKMQLRILLINEEWEHFLRKPEALLNAAYKYKLAKNVAILDVLSNHSPDENTMVKN